jgi:hypothetical protein
MRIVKSGLYNEVNEELFKNVYEPKGWKRVEEQAAPKSNENITINEPNGEQKIKEANANKKRRNAKFNDKIIKE